MATPDLSNDIAQQAVEPITEVTDGQTTTGRSIDDLIKADQYLAQKAAMSRRHRGMYHTQLVAPGAIPDGGRATGNSANFGGGFC